VLHKQAFSQAKTNKQKTKIPKLFEQNLFILISKNP